MTDNLTVSRGVFLGSSGNDAAVGFAINSDHIIIVAGNVSNSGTLYRLSPQVGSSLLSQTDLGGTVSDLALVQGTTVGQQDRIVVVGSFGIKVYDPTGATVIWQQPGNFQEVAVTTNGTVITLAADKTLSLWSNTGTLLDSSNAIGGIPEDVAISQDGTQVYVTGYTQATANLQVPFIRAFNIVNNQISDTEAWDSWDFSASAVEGQSLGADSSGIQITIAQDGNLYFLGRTDGGTNVFQREPNAIGTAEAGIVNIDTYTNFSNTGSGSFTFYAQIDPSNGDVIKGQYLLTRLSAGGGNSYSPGAITVDGEGNVYVGGTAAASLPDRANQQINGNPVAGYSGGDVASSPPVLTWERGISGLPSPPIVELAAVTALWWEWPRAKGFRCC